VRAVAAQLVDAGILSTRVDVGQELTFQLGRPAETITATDVLAAVRGRRKPIAVDRATGSTVAGLLDEIEGAAHKGAGDSTLAELLRRSPAQIDPSTARG
jgi:DNA-binding IscR family transcriptional regulator